ncbi:MAG: porin family protein [Moraxellaceae bacterium]|nr:porin family protein [Moraxellaceae bacterium]
MRCPAIRFMVATSLLAATAHAPAQSQTQTLRPATGWDLSAHLGAARMQDMLAGYPGQDRPPYELSYDAGAAWAVGLGYRWHPHWRAELELGGRHHALAHSSPAASPASGTLDSLHLMGNLYFDLLTTGHWRPYVGVGIGRSWARFADHAVNGTPLLDDSANAWAWQFIAGMRYQYDTRWSFSADYRYLASGELQVADRSGALMDPSLRSHALMFGASRRF